MSVSPPRLKGPQLNALRAFEAAARLCGFKAAAEELCVTPGAISQHVKSLEEWAGAPLFERRSQGVTLTPLGASVITAFSDAFDSLGVAVRGLRTEAAQTTINIAALPSVAQLWLSPRMSAIRAVLKDYRISITALEECPNLLREMYDISLFLDEQTGADRENVLKDDIIFPVCSPEIARRLKRPEDILNETRLYDAIWEDDWSLWATQTIPDTVVANDGPHFSLYSIAVEEAKSGAGILMGHELLIESYLRSGDLVAPFDLKVSSGKSLNIRFGDENLSHHPVRQLVDMLSS